MKNENGKLNQPKSNEAKIMKEYLELIILGRNDILREFSDKQMIQTLSYGYAKNTVIKTREKLEKESVIEKVRTGLHNEKFYRIKDYEKVYGLFRQNIDLYVNNRRHEPQVTITPTQTINGSFQTFFRLKLDHNDMKITFFYPQVRYRENICPICSGKLRKYKHGRMASYRSTSNPAHDLDRKCSKCGTKFKYNSETYTQEDIEEKNGKIRVGKVLQSEPYIDVQPTTDISSYFDNNMRREKPILHPEVKKYLEKLNLGYSPYFR